MPRWKPGARDRLERAALELFTEQGFVETTVPQITARAGLTTRTFFRHFADKREVLFAVEEELPPLVARLMAEAPPSLAPMALIVAGLHTVVATRFEGQRDYLRTRRAVVQADETLRERELRKLSVLSQATRVGFLKRGVDELTATLAAQIAVTVLDVTVNRWLDHDTEQSLTDLLDEALHALWSLTAEPGQEPQDARSPEPAALWTTRWQRPSHGDPSRAVDNEVRGEFGEAGTGGTASTRRRRRARAAEGDPGPDM